MFLAQVGIQNSFSEDKEEIQKPFFERHGIQFTYIKRNQLFFTLTSANRSFIPALALELLGQIVGRIHDFCGSLEEDTLRTNFVLIYELIDEMIDFGHPQFTDSEQLKDFVTAEAEKVYSGNLEYLLSQIPLDKLKLSDSVTEKESEKSIVKCSHDLFVEINEKISAQFSTNGFALHIKVNGLIYVKNYIMGKTNLRIQLLDNFNIINDNFFQTTTPPSVSNPFYNTAGKQQQQIRLTQIDETLNVNELEYSKLVSLFPKMGQSNILQYSLDGNFNMLPVKIYPFFYARQEFSKLDLTLKVSCKLPQNLRIKDMKISFRAPLQILRVFVHQKADANQPGPSVTHWQDVTNIQSAISYASSYIETSKAKPEDQDRADFNTSKRRIEWYLKNLRGGQERALDLSMTFKKGINIDEVQYKQLSPFTCDFDIPNYTASGIRISKMDVKVLNLMPDDPNANTEPGKWLRHKTFSGSYIFRI